MRATRDVDVLIPAHAGVAQHVRAWLEELGATLPDGSPLPERLFDGEHHIRALTPHGLLDLIPEGEEPLSFATVRAGSLRAVVDGTEVNVAGLRELVMLKRLAGRPQDLEDLRRLEIAHGELPDTE